MGFHFFSKKNKKTYEILQNFATVQLLKIRRNCSFARYTSSVDICDNVNADSLSMDHMHEHEVCWGIRECPIANQVNNDNAFMSIYLDD